MRTYRFFAALIATFATLISVTGCMNDDSRPTTKAAIQECGMTHASNGLFHVNCNVNPEALIDKGELEELEFADKQLCIINWRSDKTISSMYCEDAPETIDFFIASGARLDKQWVCEGIDDDEPVPLTFNEDGTFEILLPAIKKTDSVWRLKKATLTGTYAYSTTNSLLRLTPTKLSNDLILRAKMEQADAPSYLMRTMSWAVKDLTDTHLIANDTGKNYIKVDAINCSTPSPSTHKGQRG